VRPPSSPADIHGQGPEGHLVLNFKTELGPPVPIPKTMVILTKITVFNENVLLFIYVQRDSSRSLKNSFGPPTNQGIELAQVCPRKAFYPHPTAKCSYE